MPSDADNPMNRQMVLLKRSGVTAKQCTVRVPLEVYEPLVMRMLISGRSEGAEIIHLVRFALRVIASVDRAAAEELVRRAVTECSGQSADEQQLVGLDELLPG